MPGSVRKAQCGEGRDDNVQQTKCKTQNAKHFLQNTFQLNKKIKFSGVYNARCPLKSVCMTMTPNHNPVIFSPSTHILDYVGINM